MNAIKIPNKSIIADFKEHLDLDLNQRILFTAPFGAGKSTFINDFQEEHKGEYRFIRLYPVNYAVSANEDVFELIKFDILYELMAHHQKEIKLQKEDFDFWLRMSMFMQNKADLMPLFLFVLSQHEKIGKSAAVFIGAFEKILKPLNKGFKEYSDQIKIDELADISTFLESFKNKKGNQYEMDATSQFIYDLVDRLKGATLPEQEEIQEEDKKPVNKTVLVIDDLDRLDPDHIFRLFNIFSAHTHSIDGENKFGFDKVVFVCDIENIRKIYAHKYGKGVDFSGYMDKFYSLKPFEFNNFNYLKEKIVDIIEKSTFNNQAESVIIKRDSVVYLLSAILKILSKNKFLNLRNLLKNNSFTISINKNTNSKVSFDLFTVFEIISQMLGGNLNLEKVLYSIQETSNNQKYFDHNIKFLNKYNLVDYNYGHELNFLKTAVFKVFFFEFFNKDTESTFESQKMRLDSYNFDIDYQLRYNDFDEFKVNGVYEIGKGTNLEEYINYDLLLIDAFKKLQEYGFISKKY